MKMKMNIDDDVNFPRTNKTGLSGYLKDLMT